MPDVSLVGMGAHEDQQTQKRSRRVCTRASSNDEVLAAGNFWKLFSLAKSTKWTD